MNEQKTLLEQIREKESELNKRLELVSGEAESILAGSRLTSEKIIADADTKGRELADERYRAGRSKIDEDVEGIKGRAAKEALSLRQAGDKNLPDAIEMITKAVTFH
jgi:V/A-type H+-transporting ATPase subunit G/H